MVDKQPIPAKAVDGAFESRGAVQYRKGDTMRIIYSEGDRTSILDINLADKYQRPLVWLKTLGGRWVIDFDRASASDTSLRIFFCATCGQPFDKLNEIGTHTREKHKNIKTEIDKSEAIEADLEEEKAIAAKLAEEAKQQIEV